eukprot:scaffold9993_cov42-Phaeocystis_antarctica.AAC.2
MSIGTAPPALSATAPPAAGGTAPPAVGGTAPAAKATPPSALRSSDSEGPALTLSSANPS